MPIDRAITHWKSWLNTQAEKHLLKGDERVITGRVPANGEHGPRYLLDGHPDARFIRMNANDYLGLAGSGEVSAADDQAVDRYGVGPGAVRFISGTWASHVALEKRLAQFHQREAAIVFSSAYATVMGSLPAVVDENTAVLSDDLNHNCIINAIRLAAPRHKAVYRHLDMDALEGELQAARSRCSRVLIVTDGVFSMRGDHAPLDEIMALARRYDKDFERNVIVMADDSHGIGAFGETGRGTEQICHSEPVDLLVGTLGKAMGVNGGFLVGNADVIQYLREVSPFYIYSNPIGPAEAAAAVAAIDLIDSDAGRGRLKHLRRVTKRFKQGLADRGYQTVAGEHPVVALIVGDTARVRAMTQSLFDQQVLATGLAYPVVPAGQEEIRFQMCADHTDADIDYVLACLDRFETQ